MVTRFSDDARKAALESASEEARRRGEGRISTEHMLLGLLSDPASVAVRALGVDLAAARDASRKLDQAALAAVGIDVGERSIGPRRVRRRGRLTLTAGARALLKRSVHEALAEKVRHIEVRHLVLATLSCEPPDPAADLLAAMNVDAAEARARLGG